VPEVSLRPIGAYAPVGDQRSEVSNPKALSIPSAKGGLFFQFRPETEKDNKHPENPENPVKDKSLAEKTIEDVLLHFGETQKVAHRRYRDFVEKGIAQGRRPEFQGGGLVRSAGGNKAGLLRRAREDREKGDARILGSGDFVSETLQQAGEEWEKSYRAKMPLEELIKTVASHFEIEERDLKSPSKKKQVVEAKSAFGYLAIKKMGYSGREVGSFLNMRSYSAIRRAQEGKKLIDNRGDIWEISRIVE